MTAHCTPAAACWDAGLEQAAAQASAARAAKLCIERCMEIAPCGEWVRRDASALDERCAQHLGVEASRVVRLPALYARQPHLRRAEEQRVDRVEGAVVPLEDVGERPAIV